MRALLLTATLISTFSLVLGQGFNSVHSPNGVDVWAVGKAGNIFHSYDGGVTWASDGKGSSDFRDARADHQAAPVDERDDVDYVSKPYRLAPLLPSS